MANAPRHKHHSFELRRPNAFLPRYHPVTKQPRRFTNDVPAGEEAYPRNSYNVAPPADPWENECFWPDSLIGIDPRPRQEKNYLEPKVEGRFEHNTLTRWQTILARSKTPQDLRENLPGNEACYEMRYQASQGVKRRERAIKRVEKAVIQAFRTECIGCGRHSDCLGNQTGEECWRRPGVEHAKQQAVEREARRELKPAIKAAKAVAAKVDKTDWSDAYKTSLKQDWSVGDEEVKAGKILQEWAELEDDVVRELYEKHRRPTPVKAGPSTRPESVTSGSSWDSVEKVMEVEW